MLIGYVSDEMHVAVADVLLEFTRGSESREVRSRASGAVHADLASGRWRVILDKPGYTRKFVDLDISPDQPPVRFRLLSDRLLGYAWPKAVRSGERAELRIHSPEPFTASLWRYGWKKQLVKDLGLFHSFAPGGDRQIVPDGDFVASGVRWNHYGCAIPPDDRHHAVAPDLTGLYYFHLKAEGGAFFSFPWIVAPIFHRADIAVLASNIDWNAYNDFGGRSNYVAAGELPLCPTMNARQDSPFLRDTGARFWDREVYDPVSFDRPEPVNRVEEVEEVTDAFTRIGSEHVAPATWRLLGWLEREGFEYDLYAETQLHAGLLDLDRYRVLILDQHPEYWSREMYSAVKSWVFERGGRLMYLGGNGIDCEVRFVSDSAVTHHNTDVSDWLRIRSFTGGPGSREAPRFESTVESPSRLLGVTVSMTGMGTGAPYRTVEPRHWVFAGTGLKEGDLFGAASLSRRCPGGASGHETDKMNENSPANTQLLAKGTNKYDGGSEMVYFETPSGGEVFSVGSITYVASLPIDPVVSHVTTNVLNHFLR